MRRDTSRLELRFGLAIVAGSLLVLSGCGSGGTPTQPIQGRVVYTDGSPVQGGMIEFELISSEAADPELGRPNARGAIQQDGTFRLTTFEANDGALIGTHRVLVSVPRPDWQPADGGSPPQPAVHPKYERYETSGIEVDIDENTKELTITVERP